MTTYEAHRKLTYDTTRWDRLLFDQRTAAGGVLAESVRGMRSAEPADATDFGGELFARLYGDPDKLTAPSGPSWVGKAHEIAGALPEFDALRQSVAADPDMAALATAEMLQAIAPKIDALTRQGNTPQGAQGDGTDGQASGKAVGGARGPDAAAAVRAALRTAIARAEQAIGDAREAIAGLAPGMESAPPTHEQADAGRMTLAEQLLRTPRLREVLRRAGRIQRMARDRRQTRDEQAREEVVDIERGADIARILPAGLARLRHPMLRKLALLEIVERKAIQYRLEGKETMGRGPIVVLLDRSGSMQGDPEMWASATAIALMGAAARERRMVTVCEFTYDVDTVSRVAGGKGAMLSTADPAIVTTPDLTVPSIAIALATRKSDGGTRFEPVLAYGMACGVLDDRADLVFVTDGLASADAETIAKLAAAKARGLRIYALTVNGGRLAPVIEAIADVAVDLDRAEDVGAAIAKAIPR